MIDTSKVIHAPVGGGRYTVTAPIVKEDYGLYLLIEGLELPSTYEVDFSNSENNGTSVTMIGNSDGVLIPRQFIDSGKDVFAFLYHVGEDFGRTVYKFRIPNKVRPDRTDETPTPEEQSVIDQAINALNEAVAQTAQDVIDADASAQSASADADRAEQAKEDASTFAQRSANSAQASADYSASAQASATASANSASASAQIKADVEDLVDDAQASADASERSASNAYTYATSAERSSINASASAQSASQYASQAQSSAQTASTKAQDASGYAQTASQKATESAQSASQALSYKTDAESAKTASQTAQGLAESARDSAITAKTDAESARDEAQNLVDGISGKVEQIDSNTERIESLEDDRYKPYVTDSASGAVASFSDGADNLPLKSLIVNIDPVQDTSSGDPSPENICPISGWTGMVGFDDPVHGGVINWNQLAKNGNFEDTSNWRSAGSVISFTVENGEAVVVARASTDNTFLDQYSMTIIQGHKYYIGYDFKKDSTPRYLFVTTYPQAIYGRKLTSDTEGHWDVIVTASKNVTGIFRIGMRTDDPQGEWTYRIANVQFIDLTQVFGEGNEPTISEFRELFPNDYYDYNAGEKTCVSEVNDNTFKDISIPFGQTVYGGKLDVLSGVLRVYPEYDSYNGETLTGEWISDRDVYAVGTTPTIGAQVVNIGADGTEIQLEPHEVASLLGANNIFADTGDCTVEYRADTKLFINRLTEPDADMIADSNIVSGQYFMVGNSLFKATANIASGAQVIVGTNAIRKSLSEALNEINV